MLEEHHSLLPCPDKKKTTANFQKSDLSCLDRKNFFVKSRGHHTRFLVQKHFFTRQLPSEKNSLFRFEKSRNLRVFPTSPLKISPFLYPEKQQKFTSTIWEASISKIFTSKQTIITPLSSSENFVEYSQSSIKKMGFCWDQYGNQGYFCVFPIGEVGKTLRFRFFSKRKNLFFSGRSRGMKKCFCAKKRV